MGTSDILLLNIKLFSVTFTISCKRSFRLPALFQDIDQFALYCTPFTRNSTSAKQSLACFVKITPSSSTTVLVIALSILGIRLYNANVITSNKVDLPAPVDPVIKNKPASANTPFTKSTVCSPLSECIFLSFILQIFIEKYNFELID